MPHSLICQNTYALSWVNFDQISEIINRPAFTSDIFAESVAWNVITESENPEPKQVAEFIFKSGQSFVFSEYAQNYDMNSHPLGTCGDPTYGGVQNILQFESTGSFTATLIFLPVN